jgi:hypothetical protein
VIATEHVVLGAERTILRRDAISDDQVDEDEDEEHTGEDRSEHDLGAEHPGEHRRHPEGVEPQVVGPETSEESQRQKQEQEDPNRQHDEQAATGESAAALGHVGGDAHRSSAYG